MKEIWKDIPGYEGLYQASTDGRIRSINYSKIILRKNLQPNGYEAVTLYKNKIKKFFLVHRLIAMTFIPNSKGKPAINHKDEIRHHNSVDNLEWVTNKENQNYGHCMYNMAVAQGKTIFQYTQEGKLIRSFYSGGEAQRVTGINRYHISAVVHGKRKTAGGYVWRNTLDV